MSKRVSNLKYIFIAFALTLILLVPNSVRAEDSSTKSAERENKLKQQQEKLQHQKEIYTSRSAELKDKKEDLASRSAQIKEDRCKLISERIDFNVKRFEDSKNDHVTNYQNAKKRTEEVIARLKKEGADTTKLEQDLVKLNTLITQFASDYNAYITALKSAKTFQCGNSEGQFKKSLEDARALLIKAKQSALAVREYYQSTIRPDIQEIKKQIKTPKVSPSSSPKISGSPVATSSAQQ